MRSIFILVIALVFILSAGKLLAQEMYRDFYGSATFRGRQVESGDEIKAYDPNNVLCGTAYEIQNGVYGVHVRGDDPDTQGVDEGAVNGDPITFKINNETAYVVSGSNIWSYPGSAIQCNIDVPESPPVADAGGPYPGQEGQVVSFDGSGSQAGASEIVSYNWSFGDGGAAAESVVSHTYAAAGN